MKNTRKIVLISGMLMIVLCLCTISVSAHSPRYMGLSYEAGEVTVLIFHPTFAPRIHNVYRVEIEINSVLNLTENYEAQPRLFFVSYTYPVNVSSGDDITVSAACSLFGSITRTLTIP